MVQGNPADRWYAQNVEVPMFTDSTPAVLEEVLAREAEEEHSMLLIAGELHIGETSSGRLVDIVKKRARQEAENSHAEMIFTDGPPGIGCPVIASVRGADYVVLVTEPTPAALNDLKRVVEVVRHFRCHHWV